MLDDLFEDTCGDQGIMAGGTCKDNPVFLQKFRMWMSLFSFAASTV